MKPTVTVVLALPFAFALTATLVAAGDDPPKIKFTECPAPVQKTLHDESKGAKIESVTKETENGATTYWASVVIGERSYEIGVDDKGTLTEMSLEVNDDELPLAKCPAAVQKALQKE